MQLWGCAESQPWEMECASRFCHVTQLGTWGHLGDYFTLHVVSKLSRASLWVGTAELLLLKMVKSKGDWPKSCSLPLQP